MTEYLIASRAVSTVGVRSFHQLRRFQYVINSDKVSVQTGSEADLKPADILSFLPQFPTGQGLNPHQE
ncbi:hypothetical protein SAMN05443247_03407 [Bradyrhizobium erythrophlei]|jgi:hypothetical protein|nr:hypothetical protein SAMN05443247_03407 [Bradyrhizobium erythrophlei]